MADRDIENAADLQAEAFEEYLAKEYDPNSLNVPHVEEALTEKESWAVGKVPELPGNKEKP